MVSISFQIPDTVFFALRKTPEEFAQDIRVAAAVKWCELEKISQCKTAEIAGLTPAKFIWALSRYKVPPFQNTEAEFQRDNSELTIEAASEEVQDTSHRKPTVATLNRIRSRPRVNPLNFGLPDSTKLVREDRER